MKQTSRSKIFLITDYIFAVKSYFRMLTAAVPSAVKETDPPKDPYKGLRLRWASVIDKHFHAVEIQDNPQFQNSVPKLCSAFAVMDHIPSASENVRSIQHGILRLIADCGIILIISGKPELKPPARISAVISGCRLSISACYCLHRFSPMPDLLLFP